MVPEDNLNSGAAESHQSKPGGGPRRGRRGGRGRRGRGRVARPARAPISEGEPTREEDQAEMESAVEARVEAIQHPDQTSTEEFTEMDAQHAEPKPANYDEEPPQEIAEGDLAPEPEVDVPESFEERPPEFEPSPELVRQPEPERPERVDRRPPERQDRREFGRQGRRDQRPPRIQESRPPEPPRERVPATPAAVHEAIELVNEVIDNLRETLEDMEEVLETLEYAERQKTADEQEIDSLRRMLKSMHRPREGGGSHQNPQNQHRAR